MATMNPNMTERRSIPNRRAHGHGAAGVVTAKRIPAADWISMLLATGGIN